MNDYVKYWVPVAVLAVAYTGILMGGNYVWLGFLMFPALAVGDVLLGRDYQPRSIKNEFLADIPLWVCTVGPILMYWVFAWQVSRGAYPETSQMVGGVLSLAWTSIVPLAPAAHEMYHKRSVAARTMGRYAQLCQLDPMRDIAHVVGHHIDVATVKDGDTAKRGTTLYAFVGHAVWEQTMRDITMESDALRRRGLSPWNYRHRIYRAVLAQGIFQGGSFLLGGWQAMALTFSAVLVARFWAEAFNYFQHYGLIRVEGTPIGRRHLWNHLHWLSRTLSFEITNHADHHLNSYQRYYQLEPHKAAIEMPSLFVCFFVSLIPPLWDERIVKPALKRWDNEFATPDEQALAMAQNRAAGWPEWVNEREAPSAGSRVRPSTQGC